MTDKCQMTFRVRMLCRWNTR